MEEKSYSKPPVLHFNGINITITWNMSIYIRAKAALPNFKVLPLRQFGNWGPEVATKFDPQKDTYVMVCKSP